MSTVLQISQIFKPVAFTSVDLDGGFWAQRMKINREATIPIQYEQSKITGRIDAFKQEWKRGQPNEPHPFWDSDVAKWIEAASYSLSTHADPKLDALLDEVIVLIAGAQQPDGYLNTHFTQVEPQNRWANLRDMHELYCAGHMIEAAAAHFQATGKRSLLDVMCRYVDYIDSVFGDAPGKKRGYCGHEEIELALFKLHRVTGNPKHLNLARYFVEERGQHPHYFDIEAIARGDNPNNQPSYFGSGKYEYNQSHLPVRKQTRIVGHAVRAMYLYCAMADLAGASGDGTLLTACRTIWEDLVGTKMYLTGGIGNSRHNEGFTHGYDLPNDTAYCETCAAIGLIFWAHRLLQVTCDSEYADVMERAMYNGVISGVSLDGTKFYYENPLSTNGTHHRKEWFGCACCPPNASRLLASLGQYVYSQRDNQIAVHLYAQGRMKTTLDDGTKVELQQTTQYPWDGRVQLSVTTSQSVVMTLRLRIPGWCRWHTINVNGKPVTAAIEQGYAIVTRTWQSGDSVTLDLAMPVERIESNPQVAANVGRIALQRGPIVYCLEQMDQETPIHRIVLPTDSELAARYVPELLDGVSVIEGVAVELSTDGWGGQLYRLASAPTTRPATIRAIPYFAWDNRTAGAMSVWLSR